VPSFSRERYYYIRTLRMSYSTPELHRRL
ncbi:uncharacterized protein METZ01_LOCUS490625, partial [marine metagenome]